MKRTTTYAGSLVVALAAAGCSDAGESSYPSFNSAEDGSASDAGPESSADGSAGAAGSGGSAPDGSADGPGPGQPSVRITSPAEGASVSNPVTFTIEASNVATVELFADDYSLGPAWDPSTTQQLTYSFSGVGYERSIDLSGYDDQDQEVAWDQITITVVAEGGGDLLGSMWNTYYYVSREEDYSGADDTMLYDSNCNPIAEVPAAFSDDACIEGTGLLENGAVVNYASSCSCGRPCPTGGIVCWAELDPSEFPWGMGSKGNALEPLRSWAVDNDFVAFGTVLYAEELDGVAIPSVDGLGGFVHDGCFRADDVGGWIQDDHFDFFAGTHDMWQALETVFPTNSSFTVYTNTPKCSYLNP